jgi:hypothetical protein
MISRKTTQISPRFFAFPELGGVGSCEAGGCISGVDSGVFVFVVIQNGLSKSGLSQ